MTESGNDVRVDGRGEGEPEPTLPEEAASGEGPSAVKQLSRLTPPGRWQRQLTLGLMGLAAAASLVMAWSFAGRASYSMAGPAPLDLGTLGTAELGPEQANRYVRGAASLEPRPAVRYRRFGEQRFALLSPVAGRQELWVQHDVPEGTAGPRFVAPTRFSGRLVPLGDVGAGFWGVPSRVAEALGAGAPTEPWVLLDGATPRSERWTLALTALMVGIGGWNLLGIYLILRRLRPQ